MASTRTREGNQGILASGEDVVTVGQQGSADDVNAINSDNTPIHHDLSELATIGEASVAAALRTKPTSALSPTSSFRRSPPPVTTSRSTSRASSPTRSEASLSSDEALPTNVSTLEQLRTLPPECLSRISDRPLQHVDELGKNTAYYSLNPMTYSVVFILVIELLERFGFYGINYTQTSFLTGAYDAQWNAGLQAVSASTYVSVSVAVAYTTPFVGAILSDALLGDYGSLLTGTLVFYLPGLILIALTTMPGVLGEDFNNAALATGLLFMWPVGTGIVKSVVNVFGARQFHPLLQSSLIELYYVHFYMSINIGALVGGVVVPLVAQRNVTAAYFLPVAALALGVLLFVWGTPRYVCHAPQRDRFKMSTTDVNGSSSFDVWVILQISLLIIPFNIAYSQMSTTFIVQGTVMKKAFGFIDAACMNNADAISVLVFGALVGQQLYPWLSRRGIKIPTTHKFAIGSVFGVLAIGCALYVEHLIRSTYQQQSGQRVNILWQAPSYVLIGVGEIFAVSAAYEAAFAVSPPDKKVLASAINLFCIGGLPNVICIVLYNACAPWFTNSHGTANITHLRDYVSARMDKYFWLLLAICLAGVLLNLIPAVKVFVQDVEDKASDLLKTPKTPLRPPRKERREADEESPLLLKESSSPMMQATRHQAYLKYGSGPILNRSGSMRAGPSLTKPQAAKTRRKNIKKRLLTSLYSSNNNKKVTSNSRSDAMAQTITSGQLFIPPRIGTATPSQSPLGSKKLLARANSG